MAFNKLRPTSVQLAFESISAGVSIYWRHGITSGPCGWGVRAVRLLLLVLSER